MRFDGEHPRDWRTFTELLSVDDMEAFRRFALARGVLLELASAELVESTYTAFALSQDQPASADQ